jgi:predicted NBD/HSP70 family sugar kinase
MNPGLAKLIGIDIGRWHIGIVVTDFVGKILDYESLPSETSKGKDHLLHVVHDSLKRLLAQHPAVRAIGISSSGVIDQQAGKVLFWPQVSGWEGIPLKEIFEEKYTLPVVVDDTVHALATMEQRFGHGKDMRNFIFISIGVGIGSAIFVDGHLYTGRDGLAGELGHVTVEENGKLCSCGNRGCLELYSSASAIIRRVREELQLGVTSSLTDAVGGNLDQLSVEKIAAAAQAHDRLSERVLSEAGRYLGVALASVVNLLNPERIVLQGKVPQAAQELLLGSLLYNLRHRALAQSIKGMDVVVSQFGEEKAAVGAVFTAGEEVLQTRCREMEGKLSPSTEGLSLAQDADGKEANLQSSET